MEGKVIGGYRFRELIGKGGMGEVWLVSEEGPENFRKNFVVKCLLPEAVKYISPFLSEARLGARLHHQNVVQVIKLFKEIEKRKEVGGDSEKQIERFFLVMEYIEGATLKEILKKRKKLSVEVAVFIMVNLCRGIGWCHKINIDGKPANIIHRDIAPDNCIISNAAEVKASDFGIAKASAALMDETHGSQIKGKDRYFAPEVLRQRPLTQAVDQYQLGVVFYEMLAGKPAFHTYSSQYDVMDKIIHGEIEPLSEIDPSLPSAICDLVHRMIHLDPTLRYPSVDEVQQELYRLCPQHVHGEKELAEIVQEVSAEIRGRRPTSPYYSVGEEFQDFLKEKILGKKSQSVKSRPDDPTVRPSHADLANEGADGVIQNPLDIKDTIKNQDEDHLSDDSSKPTTKPQKPEIKIESANKQTIFSQTTAPLPERRSFASMVAEAKERVRIARRRKKIQETVLLSLGVVSLTGALWYAFSRSQKTSASIPINLPTSEPVAPTAIANVNSPLPEQDIPTKSKNESLPPRPEKSRAKIKNSTRTKTSEGIGTLALASDPENRVVTISVDGTVMGRAPTRFQLVPGRYEIELTSTAPGAKAVRKRITIESGREYTFLASQVFGGK